MWHPSIPWGFLHRNCYWALSPLGSETIESICMQSVFKHQVRWNKIRIASLWRLFHVLKFTSASRSGRYYGGSQADTVLWALHLQLTVSIGKGREVVIMAANIKNSLHGSLSEKWEHVLLHCVSKIFIFVRNQSISHRKLVLKQVLHPYGGLFQCWKGRQQLKTWRL